MPDVSYVADPNAAVTKAVATEGMPDFVIEIQSPRDSIKDMREKAEFYLANGVQLVWLIYPRIKIVETYDVDSIDILLIGATVDGSPVVPGFRLEVEYIFKGLEQILANQVINPIMREQYPGFMT